MEEADGRRLDTPLCDSRQRLSPIFLSATSALKIYFRLTSSVSRDNIDSPFPFIVEFKGQYYDRTPRHLILLVLYAFKGDFDMFLFISLHAPKITSTIEHNITH